VPTALESPATWIALAYLVAAIPVGLLIARARGVDLRRVGSGNIGATNAVRALGRGWGAPVFALDVLKAGAPVWLASRPWALGGRPDAEVWVAAVGLAAVLGHVFPIYLRFRGGKGVACALGVFATLEPWAALCSLVLYVQTLALTRVSAIGSLTGVSTLTLFVLLTDPSPPRRGLAAVVCVLIWWRHRSNVRALVTEARERARREHERTRG
jgi:glycerol-3-phosphate acyltransferase PlsY